MKHRLCASCAALFIVLGLLASASAQDTKKPDPATPSEGEPNVQVDSRVFDFGELWQGERATREFTVINDGTAPLTISVKSTCGCTISTKPKSPLPPGESDKFTIKYDTLKHTGSANQTITLMTNDPDEPEVPISVRGKVKPLYQVMPRKGFVFEPLLTDSHATRSIKITSKYDGPLPLKLKEGQNFRPLDISFKEVEPGKEFELTASTVPPLTEGWNRVKVVLTTGLETSPELPIDVAVYVQANVLCEPSRLITSRQLMFPTSQKVVVKSRADTPVKILKVQPSHPSIKCEVGDAQTVRDWIEQPITVALPPGGELPPGDAYIEIFTDSSEERFQKIQVPIQVVEPRQTTKTEESPDQADSPPNDEGE